MRKSALRELARRRDFISGIYNYCDRWCERCPLTARCLVYTTEQADHASADPEVHDINSAKFWSRLESIFQEAHEMIMELAEEAGMDREEFEAEAVTVDRAQHREEAKHHELSLSARRYAELVQYWFVEEFAVEGQVHDDTTGKSKNTEDDIDVSDAIEVIRWYQFFIAAKVYRALMGRDDKIIEDALRDREIPADDEVEEEEAQFDRIADDSDGSAKIALIAIDRSSSAWRMMLSSVPEKADSIKPMLLELERLRRATELIFPRARDFIRPGFDEVISDFVS
ncbi:MAG: hypothetical protein QOI77_53 [Blastocatellia bacterium]|jgi:hypothetical protein|nr:hypothetical protein [Blastocatellia bacterium]